jgi:hypothetical protein
MPRPRRKTPPQVLRNRENFDRFKRENPVGFFIFMVIMVAFVLAIPTCSQLLKLF